MSNASATGSLIRTVRRELLTSSGWRLRMLSAQQFHLLNGLYLVVLVVVAILTRGTARRLAGALAGAAAMYPVGLALIALGEHVGWWHWLFPWEPNFLTAAGINCVLCGFVFLITWRIARRFGARG